MELWLGLLLVALFIFMYIKGRRQYQGMRKRRRKVLDRYRDMDSSNSSHENKPSEE